jgi:hypothetical protein
MKATKRRRQRPQVNCPAHGPSSYAILCGHLARGHGFGYFAMKPFGPSPAQAWCELCDGVVEREGGWTETAKAFARLQLVCAVCWEHRLESHHLIQRVAEVHEE